MIDNFSLMKMVRVIRFFDRFPKTLVNRWYKKKLSLVAVEQFIKIKPKFCFWVGNIIDLTVMFLFGKHFQSFFIYKSE